MPERVFTYNFRGNFSNLSAGLTASGRAVQDFGNKLTALDKDGAKMRAGLTQIGDTAGRVGLLFAAGVGAAIGVAANFDKAMSSVQAATHETAENMDDLRQAAIKAGADTAYSASEAAGAIEELAKAGVTTKDILGGGLAGSLDLAAAGAIEVADAAEIAATAMTQFQLGGEQVTHIADLLAAGAGKAQGGVEDLGMALKQSGLVASQTGLSIEETTGTLAAFASAGLIGSDAGTSFKTMLQSLTPSGKKAADEMDRLGISAYDAQGNFIGMTEFAGVLQTALGDLSVEQQNAALKTIFGSDAVRAASVIFQQGAGGIQSWIDKTNDSGYAAETAATRLDNLAGDLEQFKGSLETALIGTGEGAQGPLRKLVQGATDATNAFNDMPGPAKDAALALGAITAVTGGALWFGSKVINGVANTRQALSDLGFTADRTSGSLGRLTRAGGRIAGLAGAITLLGNALADATGAKLDVSDLQRDLEALANGKSTEVLDRIVSDIGRLGEVANQATEPLYETSTLFGILGNTPNDNAGDNIAAVDEALASLVESGNAELAAEAFGRIAAALTGLPEGSSFSPKLVEGFDSYSTALDNAATSAEGAGEANSDLADETGAAGVAAAKAAERQEALADKLREQREAARDSAKGWIGLGDALDNTKKSLGDWLRQLERQAEALRDFTQNARTAAKRGLDDGLIKSLNEAGPAGALRMKQLANATDSEIKRANKAWRDGQRAIADYVNMQVPAKKLRVDTAQALSAVSFLQARIDSLRSKTIAIDIATGQKRAGGGPIYGPGTKTSDSVPVMASRGEFMMSAAAVDHYGIDTMFRMNARRLASGGSVDGIVGGGSTFSSGVSLRSLEYLLGGLAELSKREIEVRQRQLEKMGRIADRQVDAAQARLDEERAALKDLRNARREFMQSVTDNFRSSLFGDTDLVEAFRSGVLGMSALGRPVVGTGANGAVTAEDVQAVLTAMSPQQIAALQAQANAGILDQNTADANRFTAVLEQLRAMGLRGGAYAELAQRGNLSQAEAYLQMGPGVIRSLVADFQQRNEALRGLGQSVGNAQFSADIRAQLHVTRRMERLYVEQRDEVREINQAVKALQRIEAERARHARNAPERAAKEFAKGLNDATSNSRRMP